MRKFRIRTKSYLDYVTCCIRYYNNGNGKYNKKYSNPLKTFVLCTIEYVQWRKEERRAR